MVTRIKPKLNGKTQTRVLKRVRLKKTLENGTTSAPPARKRMVTGFSFYEQVMLHVGEKLRSTQIISRLSSAIIHAVFPWVLLCGVYSCVVYFLQHFGYLDSIDETKAFPQAAIALNLALSLLLVFRTNAAHDRLWEARKLWGALVNTTRNLTRGIWIMIEEPGGLEDRRQKEAMMRLVSSFAIAMKFHLRREPMHMNRELATLMSPLQYSYIQQTSHGPLELVFWIGDYLQYQYESRRLSAFQLQDLHELLNAMVDILGECERILKTPMPFFYTITLRFLFVAYFLVLPLGMASTLGWAIIPVTLFTSFIFLSIHKIGCEIEKPFGHTLNNLPLESICNTIKANIENLIEEVPSSRNRARWPEGILY